MKAATKNDVIVRVRARAVVPLHAIATGEAITGESQAKGKCAVRITIVKKSAIDAIGPQVQAKNANEGIARGVQDIVPDEIVLEIMTNKWIVMEAIITIESLPLHVVTKRTNHLDRRDMDCRGRRLHVTKTWVPIDSFWIKREAKGIWNVAAFRIRLPHVIVRPNKSVLRHWKLCSAMHPNVTNCCTSARQAVTITASTHHPMEKHPSCRIWRSRHTESVREGPWHREWHRIGIQTRN